MKMSKLLSSTLMLGALLFGAGKAAAQGGIAPSQQLGIGVFGGGNGQGGGATLQYAFTPAVQLGLELGIGTVSNDNASSSSYTGGLYARWLFEGAVNPLIQAGFRINGTSNTTKSASGDVTVSGSSNEIYAGLGLEYFFTRNVGVFGLVEVLSLDLDPSQTTFGLNSGRIGVEWFFNP